MADEMEDHGVQSPSVLEDKEHDEALEGGEDVDYDAEYDEFRSPNKRGGLMRGMMGDPERGGPDFGGPDFGGPDFGPRGPPHMGMGRPPGFGPGPMHGPPHGPPGGPRFRGRGFGPRGPPGFRGPPPPHYGMPPRGAGFRGRPPPNWDPNWGPMPPPGMGPPPPGHMMGPPPPGMPPHMMSPMGMPPSNGPSGGPSSSGQYCGPPGMGPPPNMVPSLQQPSPSSVGGINSMDLLSGEVWVETKANDGKSYYYNARTRETTWTKPEGNVKVLTQEQVESIAQAAGVQPGSGPNSATGPTTAAQAAVAQANNTNTVKSDDESTDPSNDGYGPGMPNTMQPPPGMMQGPPPGMPPYGGPPPQYGGPPPYGMPPPGYQGYPPGYSGGPPGAWNMPPQQGVPPGMPPMQDASSSAIGVQSQAQPGAGGVVSAPPVSALPNPAVAAAAAPQPANAEDSALIHQIDPEIVARASEWSEHRAPDGRFYYHNAKLGQSVWEKPPALKDLETAKLAAAQGINTMPVMTGPTSVPLNSSHRNDSESSEEEEEDDTVPAGTQPISLDRISQPAVNGTAVSAMAGSDSEDENEKERKRKIMEEEEVVMMKKKKEDDEKAKELQKQQDRSRPVSSTPVAGTPWCVVWTGDTRVFFYNPSSRTSVWERPDELIGRSDVDKLVNSPPEQNQASSGAGSNGTVNENPSMTSLKREAKDKEDSPVPIKKAKKEEVTTKDTKEEVKPQEKKQIEVGKDAAMEAEVRAARERAIVPLETRIKSFREMLAEKEVSAFSTWEKELHKIVFDPRYLLLTSKERKQVFEKYVKERAEEERREKRNKMKERRDDFRRLMEEANLHGKSSFSDFAQKYGKDDRFKNIEKMREREGIFNEYLLEVRKREKDEKLQRREQTKRDFFEMLKERSEIDRHSRWSDSKKLVESDPRYRAVDSSTQREDWFREHIKLLKEERKREKERRRSRERRRSKDRDRSRDKDRHKEDKERDKDKKKDEDREKEKEKKEEKKEDKEKEEGENDEEEGEHESEGNSEDEREKEQKDKEKQARVEASLREREKEVQRTLATHMRDRDKEREQHKRDEAVQHFNALLADLVRNADLVWKEAKRQLRKDSRWELAELLDRDEKEKLFLAHVEQLGNKKRDKFREMLSEVTELSLTSTWKDIKKVVKDDPRCTKFSSSDRKCEREFKEYLKDKLVEAKSDFRELLQETKLITHKSLKMVQENEAHQREMEEILKKDKRYLVLDHMPEERSRLLRTYLEDLEKRGPPPPPTASEPSRRPTK